jgi:hypothetical protein
MCVICTHHVTTACRFFIATQDGPISEQVSHFVSHVLLCSSVSNRHTHCMLAPSPAAISTKQLLSRTPVRACPPPAPLLLSTPAAVDAVFLCLPLRRCLVQRNVSAVSAEDFKALAALLKSVREVTCLPIRRNHHRFTSIFCNNDNCTFPLLF